VRSSPPTSPLLPPPFLPNTKPHAPSPCRRSHSSVVSDISSHSSPAFRLLSNHVLGMASSRRLVQAVFVLAVMQAGVWLVMQQDTRQQPPSRTASAASADGGADPSPQHHACPPGMYYNSNNKNNKNNNNDDNGGGGGGMCVPCEVNNCTACDASSGACLACREGFACAGAARRGVCVPCDVEYVSGVRPHGENGENKEWEQRRRMCVKAHREQGHTWQAVREQCCPTACTV
jgi:hypothetical protein